MLRIQNKPSSYTLNVLGSRTHLARAVHAVSQSFALSAIHAIIAARNEIDTAGKFVLEGFLVIRLCFYPTMKSLFIAIALFSVAALAAPGVKQIINTHHAVVDSLDKVANHVAHFKSFGLDKEEMSAAWSVAKAFKGIKDQFERPLVSACANAGPYGCKATAESVSKAIDASHQEYATRQKAASYASSTRWQRVVEKVKGFLGYQDKKVMAQNRVHAEETRARLRELDTHLRALEASMRHDPMILKLVNDVHSAQKSADVILGHLERASPAGAAARKSEVIVPAAHHHAGAAVVRRRMPPHH